MRSFSLRIFRQLGEHPLFRLPSLLFFSLFFFLQGRFARTSACTIGSDRSESELLLTATRSRSTRLHSFVLNFLFLKLFFSERATANFSILYELSVFSNKFAFREIPRSIIKTTEPVVFSDPAECLWSSRICNSR